jgi:hypothetical protein
MDVGFEDVPQTEMVGLDVLNHLVCGSRAKRSGRVVKVEHRVYYGGYTGLRITHHIGDGRGSLVEEVLHARHGVGVPSISPDA